MDLFQSWPKQDLSRYLEGFLLVLENLVAKYWHTWHCDILTYRWYPTKLFWDLVRLSHGAVGGNCGCEWGETWVRGFLSSEASWWWEWCLLDFDMLKMWHVLCLGMTKIKPRKFMCVLCPWGSNSLKQDLEHTFLLRIRKAEVSCCLLLVFCYCSISKSCPNSLRPDGLHHARLPCPSLSPRICSNWCPLNQWCHPTISPSVTPIYSSPQSFPATGSFPMSWLFPSGGQSIGTSASVLPVNIQGWFPLGLTGLRSLLSKGLSSIFSSTTVWKHQFFGTQPSLWSSFHICTWLLENPWLWLYRPLSAK